MYMKIPLTLRVLVSLSMIASLRAAPAELDPTFGGTGKVTTPIGFDYDAVSGMAVQDDGKIVVAGQADLTGSPNAPHFAVARYNSNGSLDLTFNGTGKTTTVLSAAGDSAAAIAVQSDGRILVAGRARRVNSSQAPRRYKPAKTPPARWVAS